MFTVYCEICEEPIAKIEPSKLKVPMMGKMFESLEPDRDIPPPFHPDLEWEFMKCPYCGFRPFVEDDQVKVITAAGKEKFVTAKEETQTTNERRK